MVIGGLQKLSLVDYPEKVALVVFTQGCLFRCPYCHNPELIEVKKEGNITEEETLRTIKLRKDFINGVCITGGEPTIQQGLPEFMRKIKAMKLPVKLDTNGVNPGMVEGLITAGLVDYIAMDIKHAWEKYGRIARAENPTALENCKKTFHIIQDSGISREFRTTILPGEHTEEDFYSIVSYLKPGEKYFIQNIRYKNTLDRDIDKNAVLDTAALAENLRRAFPNIDINVR